jgi:hypothetical protein
MNAFSTILPGAGAKDAVVVNVFQDVDGETWIATSDEIPIATEGSTLDELIDRVWSVAPEIAALNGHPGELRLRFVMDTKAAA